MYNSKNTSNVHWLNRNEFDLAKTFDIQHLETNSLSVPECFQRLNLQPDEKLFIKLTKIRENQQLHH